MKPSVRVRAPAKLNLTLEVLSRRDDGLHNVRSVMVPITIFDELTLRPHPSGFVFSCSESALQSRNLVEEALQELPLASRALEVSLTKRIPIEAGMGGGSSDAAAVLIAAQDGELELTAPVDYIGLARSLGSDVPFFLAQTAALVEGTGERVTALGPVPDWHAVVVKPPVCVSTAQAYQGLDRRERPSRARSSSVSLQMGEALQRRDLGRALSLLQNDFHDDAVASHPQIQRAIDALIGAGATSPLLTGSGSAVFALTATEAECHALASHLGLEDRYGIFPCAFWSGPSWRTA